MANFAKEDKKTGADMEMAKMKLHRHSERCAVD